MFIFVVAAVLVSLSPQVYGGLDDDSNGMSDVWQKAYGINSAVGDLDGDGKSNASESVAGTDGKDAGSVLKPKMFTMPNGNTAHLEWVSVAGKSYQIQIATELGKWQNAGQPILGNGSVLSSDLSLATTFSTGTIRDSRWDSASSENLDRIKLNVSSNVAPTFTRDLATLDIAQSSPNASYFGHWVRGWLIPPSTGSYTFWIASDDVSELWLSTTSAVANKVKIASVPGWTGYKEWTKYPDQQQSLPVVLEANKAYYLEVYQYEYVGGDHLAVAWTGPGILTKTIMDGKYFTSNPLSFADQIGSAKTAYFRVSVSDLDSDNDGVSDADEILIGYNRFSATTAPRINDASAIRSALAATNVITVGTSQSRAYESSGSPGRLTFFRSGNIGAININYSAGGTASNGLDCGYLSGTVTIPIGQNSVSVDVVPKVDALLEPSETVSVQVTNGAGYVVGNPANATVTIDDLPDALYVANLRPDLVTRSGGYGTASLNLAGNRIFGNLSISLGNLSAPQIGTELYIANGGSAGPTILSLPTGQIAPMRWEFTPAAGYTQAQILAAISEGRLYARVVTNAGSEIFGQFVTAQGWQTMPIPATPPTPSTAISTPEDAARFLSQATYGPTLASIEALVATGNYNTWITQQMGLQPSLHLPYALARVPEFMARNPNDDGWQRPLSESWWQNAVAAPDQLRQRMAFALSQIFVISQVGALDGAHEGVANYYDLLVTHAFGNFRTLLKDVTLSPMMGVYLSMLRNQKPNAVTGAEPDENYAREVMQLFTIGLSQLNPDGSLKLSAAGLPIPTYSQSDIVGLAHVFTGWSYATPSGQNPNFLYGPYDDLSSMVAYENYHDAAAKTILNNTAIPAGQTASQDLEQAIDALFNHPNVGPFISRQLIQRFVTSNPSPGYIFRVASVFNNNGVGVRGDLAAVIRAILTDYEARSANYLADQAYGKQREPLIRLSHLFRALKILAPLPNDPRRFLDLQYSFGAQAPFHSPSVFNFFQPNYIPPGPLAAAGVFAPEFQITSETSVIQLLNLQRGALFWGIYTPEPLPPDDYSVARFDFADQVNLLTRPGFTFAQNQAALLDHLNLILLNGGMTPRLRAQINEAYAELPTWYSTINPDHLRNRVRMAIYLIIASPEYVIQK